MRSPNLTYAFWFTMNSAAGRHATWVARLAHGTSSPVASKCGECMSNLVQDKLLEGLRVIDAVARDVALHATLTAAAEATADALKDGRTLMVAGNGGSAADAQHLVAEFVSRLDEDRPAMRAVALTTDTSILTAVGNDYGYEHVFARQIEAIGQSGDV